MQDIITFGSATQDIYLKSKKFLPVLNDAFQTGKGICINFGSKLEVEDILFTWGGGGTNSAVTFAKQGFKVSYCGMIGDDLGGNFILQKLKESKIGTEYILKNKNIGTNVGVILASPAKDRTILVYRGASDVLKKEDIPWNKIKNTKWFYLAPFAGELSSLTKEIIDFAKNNKIKIAFNPGYNQLNLPQNILEDILNKVDVLILNREEASLLTGISYQQEKEIFKKIDLITKGIVIMTKGSEGVVVSDGKYLYKSKAININIIDTTGAGDAFGSGFVSGLMQKNDIEYAIQLAMANSCYNLTKWGAKEGLLEKNQNWEKVIVEKEPCSLNNFCEIK